MRLSIRIDRLKEREREITHRKPERKISTST
jgi:hypothetical protein